MDFNFTPEENAFRQQVRDWMRDNLPTGWGETVFEPTSAPERAAFRLDWEKKLNSGGWGAVDWPKEYGGRGASLVEQTIFLEEAARASAPQGLNIVGRNLIGPTLIHHGTEAQKKRFLPKIIAAEEVWSQGFSEPGAGSDLASLRTRALPDGDRFIVNGQKVWTSFAQYAQWLFLLARTDPAAPKHKGLSFLLVDLKTPGITIRPLTQITGDSEFNEVFFDDVVVPKENLVGKLNEGWQIAMTTLTFERGPAEAMARQVRFRAYFDHLVKLSKTIRTDTGQAAKDPVVRQKLMQSYIEIELMRLNCLRGFSKLINGKPLGRESSFTKLYWSEMYQRLCELGLEIQGSLAPEGVTDLRSTDTTFQQLFLASRSATIASGSSEIQRNIISERVLGMPRQP